MATPFIIETISQFNDLLGLPTLHPLVSVIDFSKMKPVRLARHSQNFYAVYLKEMMCGNLLYGRQTYDYQEGTVVCIGPGQVTGFAEEDLDKPLPKGQETRGNYGLLFHPDLIHGTGLGKHIHEYSFFSYESREALHLSEDERRLFIDTLKKIDDELHHAIDRLSKRLIATQIELLLDYCLRFYERQFITRQQVNHTVITRFERLLNDYFSNGLAVRQGLPTVKYCASELCLSPNYFGDLVKRETGRTAQDMIQQKVISVGKEELLDPQKSVAQVADSLGFQYSHHFTRVFKKAVGMTPSQYRATMPAV